MSGQKREGEKCVNRVGTEGRDAALRERRKLIRSWERKRGERGGELFVGGWMAEKGGRSRYTVGGGRANQKGKEVVVQKNPPPPGGKERGK